MTASGGRWLCAIIENALWWLLMTDDDCPEMLVIQHLVHDE
jgi:hypothetical protein